MKQIKDHFFQQAKKEGFAARSVYKLQEINQKHKIIKPGQIILDLGCSPGSWMQYISQQVGPKGWVIGIDQQKLSISLKKNMQFIHSDIDDLEPEQLRAKSQYYDLICSDMAPKTTGIKAVDAEKSYQLCLTAFKVAESYLKKRGFLLMKIFQGFRFDEFIKLVKENYQSTRIIKPTSTRKESKEIYVLAGRKKT